MQSSAVFAHVDHIHKGHDRRRSEFKIPSAVQLGHELTVRRIDENSRSVSKSDLHLLMYTDIAPGTTKTVKNHSGKPFNVFTVYMSAKVVHQGGPPSPRVVIEAIRPDGYFLLPPTASSRPTSPNEPSKFTLQPPSRPVSR